MGLENLVPQNLGFLGGIEVREVYRKVREVQKFDFLPGDPIQPPGDRVMSKIRKQNSTLEISYKHLGQILGLQTFPGGYIYSCS